MIDWLTCQRHSLGSASGLVNPVRRAVWYGLADLDPRRRQEPYDAEHERGSEPAEEREVEPAHAGDEETAASAAMYTSAVPRSGCRKTSSIGTAASAIAVATVRSSISRWRSTSNRDREHEQGLAELRGLELERPMSIVAPTWRIASANTNTTTIPPSASLQTTRQ